MRAPSALLHQHFRHSHTSLVLTNHTHNLPADHCHLPIHFGRLINQNRTLPHFQTTRHRRTRANLPQPFTRSSTNSAQHNQRQRRTQGRRRRRHTNRRTSHRDNSGPPVLPTALPHTNSIHQGVTTNTLRIKHLPLRLLHNNTCRNLTTTLRRHHVIHHTLPRGEQLLCTIRPLHGDIRHLRRLNRLKLMILHQLSLFRLIRDHFRPTPRRNRFHTSLHTLHLSHTPRHVRHNNQITNILIRYLPYSSFPIIIRLHRVLHTCLPGPVPQLVYQLHSVSSYD